MRKIETLIILIILKLQFYIILYAGIKPENRKTLQSNKIQQTQEQSLS